MSKVQLQGNVSGTGIFTIASPNSNTDRTLTLPDNTGTLLSSASTLSPSQLGSQFSINSGAPSNSFVMDASGRVTMQFQPFANASSNVVTSANNVIPLTTFLKSRGGLTIANNRMTVPVAGAYAIGYSHLGNSGSGACQVAVAVNGGQIGGSLTQDTNSANDTFSTQIIQQLAANDYIEFLCIQGATHGNPNYNSMWAFLIG